MPIKPENLHLYPKRWKLIRAEILARASHRCECAGDCGVTHPGIRCPRVNHQWFVNVFGIRVWVVLTIAHLNHNPRFNHRRNLKAMCQGCHLRYDKPLHLKNAAETRLRKRGQLALPI